MAVSSIIHDRPGPSVQEILAGDVNKAPAVMLSESPAVGLSEADVSSERYFSKAWHDREVEKVLLLVVIRQVSCCQQFHCSARD